MRNKYLYITLLSILGFNAEATAQMMAQAPQLVVSIVVDQLRTDHLEAYAPLYSPEGLKRLLAEGRIYPNASYRFSPVDRASAAASLSTGSTPYYNSITGTEWLNRKTLRPTHILYDEKYKFSPQQLATSTLGDELKVATNGAAKVYAFATNSECAILTAGHAADGVAWIQHGRWNTTEYYTPVDQWLSNYTRQFPPAADSNQSVAEAAQKCVEQTGIGQDDKTDLLYISLETQPDMESYVALDRTIANLVKGITQSIPLEHVLFILTSTGSTERYQQEQISNFRIPTGKFYINRTANLLNMYLGAIYGIEQYIEANYHNQLFFNHRLIERKNINMSDILHRSQDFILQLSGVRNVYTSSQLQTSDSRLLEKIRNGFNLEKCGDLFIDIAPGWELVNEDTHQSSVSRASYIPFPIIFFGGGIEAGRILSPATVDCIAPTVARTLRIRAPNACSSEPLF